MSFFVQLKTQPVFLPSWPFVLFLFFLLLSCLFLCSFLFLNILASAVPSSCSCRCYRCTVFLSVTSASSACKRKKAETEETKCCVLAFVVYVRTKGQNGSQEKRLCSSLLTCRKLCRVKHLEDIVLESYKLPKMILFKDADTTASIVYDFLK